MNLIEKMIGEVRASELPTILYGSGALSVIVSKYLEEKGISIAGFAADREYYKGNSVHDGKPVYILEEYIAENPCNIILAFSYLSLEWENKIRDKAASYPDTKIYILDFQAYLSLVGDHTSYENFYKDNKQTLEKLRDELCDENSKSALDDFIEQKLTGTYRKPFSNDPQYFESDIISFSDDEIFVDCGAFTGDTVIEFAKCLKQSGKFPYKKIYALEPDPKNVEELTKNLEDFENVTVIVKGVYDHTGILHFTADANSGSRISDDGIEIEVTSIDDIIQDDNVTFIKMDIEGSELMALEGAEKTIRRCKPKLAICVYHRVEDLTTIPQYIKSLNPDYRLYFRKYWPNALEAVLYAV